MALSANLPNPAPEHRSGVVRMSLPRTLIVTVTFVFASASAFADPEHGKGQQHQPRRHIAKNYSAPPKGAVQYGNNTRDNTHGGVYGEYSFKGE
jgi:hypothetical protein